MCCLVNSASYLRRLESSCCVAKARRGSPMRRPVSLECATPCQGKPGLAGMLDINILLSMTVLRRPHRYKATRVWQFLFCLTVLSFLCRAVIPVGYMPDPSGGRDGKISFTFCTMGGGTSTILWDLTEQSDQSSPDDHFENQECPFGIVVSQTLMPSEETPSLAGVVAHRPAPLLHRNEALPPLPALGPPLGSRAPPSNLG